MDCPYPTGKLEAFVDGAPAILARDPNIGDDALRTWQWVGYEQVTAVDAMRLRLTDVQTARRWAAALGNASDDSDRELWLHAYTKYDWRDAYLRLASITPNGSEAYWLTRDAQTAPQYPWKSGCRFYALNNLHLLDAPGEYFVSSTGTLYLRMPEGKGGQTSAVPAGASASAREAHEEDRSSNGPPTGVVVSVLDTVLSVAHANHTSWSNVIVEAARGGAVELTGEGIRLVNVTVRNAGGTCVSLSGRNGTIQGSVMYGCGEAGMAVDGGDERTLAPSGHRILNNTITNFSRIVRTYRPAIAFSGVGHYVAHNSIANGPHCAIQGGGNEMLFEHNVIRHVSYECTDTGAFYVGRSWAQRGNVARFNTFDTIRPTERLAQASCSQNAFYLDDQMSGWDFYGNTIINSSTGVLLGGGRDNFIHGNRFINNDVDVAFDDRGLTWQNDSAKPDCWKRMGNSTTSCFYNALHHLHYTQPPYATRYPRLPGIYDEHPGVPVGNVIEDNVFCHARSKGGGKFLSASVAQVRKWLSSASNNVEACDGVSE